MNLTARNITAVILTHNEFDAFSVSLEMIIHSLEEICALEGIDMIFFGPGDFSHAIGHPAEFDHPEVTRVRKLVVETAHKYGKFAGTVSVPSLEQCFAEGFDYVNCGSDVALINKGCAAIMQQYRDCTR